MSDNNKNELDQYGVWVKNPPEADKDSSMPDFSFLDAPTDTEDASTPNIDASLTSEEEIDLDSFITDGFSDPNEAFSPKTEESVKTKEPTPATEEKNTSTSDFDPSSLADGELSLDDFFDTPSDSSNSPSPSSNDGEISLDDFMDGISFDAAPAEPKAEEIADEDPMDIDLEFDDSMPVIEAQDDDVEEEAVEEKKEESIAEDTADFEDIFDDMSEEKEERHENDLKEGEEFIDINEFGLDDNDVNPILPGGETKEAHKETVDYNMTVDEEDDKTFSQASEEDTRIAEEDDDNIDLTSDSEDHSVSLDANQGANPSNFSAPDDDFDVDALMNSVEDENGQTTSIGAEEKTADIVENTGMQENIPVFEETVPLAETEKSEEEVPVFEESINKEENITEETPEVQVEEIEDFNTDNIFESPLTDEEISDTIPDSFEEETASLGITDEHFEEDATLIDKDATIIPEMEDSVFTEDNSLNNEDIPAELPELEENSDDKNIISEEEISEELDEPLEIADNNFAPKSSIIEEIEDTHVIADTLPDDVLDEEPKVAETNSSESENILKQIVGELNSLKTEISGLKSDLANMKANGITSTPEKTEDTDDQNGFFSGLDDDDTIALSGDELNNILTNADFTSSSENEDPSTEEISDLTPAEEEKIPLTEEAENNNEDISVPEVEILPADNISKPIDIFKEDEPEALTDDKLSYLEEDKSQNAEETDDDDEENSEPVEQGFDNWNTSSAPVAKSPASEETKTSEETKNSDDSSIPAGMKEEIKSVLSYMDQLLENLPEDKITEFAQSEQFETYKKLFNELGLS